MYGLKTAFKILLKRVPFLPRCLLILLGSRKKGESCRRKDSNFKTGRKYILFPFFPLVLLVKFLSVSLYITLPALQRQYYWFRAICQGHNAGTALVQLINYLLFSSQWSFSFTLGKILTLFCISSFTKLNFLCCPRFLDFFFWFP